MAGGAREAVFGQEMRIKTWKQPIVAKRRVEITGVYGGENAKTVHDLWEVQTVGLAPPGRILAELLPNAPKKVE